ncbi:MAG: YqaA family protein [Methyloligellaceae bacterium]
MLQKLYDWTMGLAAHRHATWALGFISFIESSFFPIPPHPVLAGMVLANRDKAWLYAAIASITSVLGGIAGYLIGFYLYDLVGKPIIDLYGKAEHFETFTTVYNEKYGAWAVFVAGVTPFPYKVITIASGITKLDFTIFVVASVAARSLIFFTISALLYFYGPPIRTFVEKRLALMATVFCVLLIGGFALIKYAL